MGAWGDLVETSYQGVFAFLQNPLYEIDLVGNGPRRAPVQVPKAVTPSVPQFVLWSYTLCLYCDGP